MTVVDLSDGDQLQQQPPPSSGRGARAADASRVKELPLATTGGQGVMNGGEPVAESDEKNNKRTASSRGETAGWITGLYMRARNSCAQSTLNFCAPFLPWIPLALRAKQVLFSLISFSIMASSDHPVACIEPSLTFCWTGRDYKDFTAFEFLVVVTVITFLWSAMFLMLDVIGVLKPGGFTPYSFISYVAFYGDAILSFLIFGAACASAGLRTGFDDMNANYCATVGSVWCSKIVAAVVFSFITWMCLVPSAALNTSNLSGPW